jgi:hypothetical protein
MKTDIPETEYRAIESFIESAESAVGIDAKKTHVLILYKLSEIERRIQALEERAADATSRSGAR